MRILLGLAILATLALFASSPRLYAWRRTRLGAALSTGGWIMVGVGFGIGPHGAGLVLPEQLLVVRPLILFCLGWVGLMIGLQLDRRLPTVLPPAVMRLSLWDAVVSFALFAAAAWAVLGAWASPGIGSSALPAALVLGACGIGWSQEVRSLSGGASKSKGGAVRAVLRATAGLSSVLAVPAYALAIMPLAAGGADAAGLSVSPARVGIGLGASVLIGLMMGLMGYWLMGLAGRGEGQFLVVLIGLVSFTAGAAATLGYAPLLVALVAGAVVANLPERTLRKFKRGIIDAEQPMAMAVMLAAGVLADLAIGWRGAALVVAMLMVRVVVKLGLVRPLVRRAAGAAQSPAGDRKRNVETRADQSGWASSRGGPAAGVMRQSPLAIALALAYAVSGPSLREEVVLSGGQILTVVLLSGLMAEMGPLATPWGGRHAPSMNPTRNTRGGA